MKSLAFFLLGFWTVAALSAEVIFSGLDLDSHSRLLFSARNTTSSGSDYQVWFRSDLAAGSLPEPLTFFPESATYLPALGQLQIHNRFGVWRLDTATTKTTLVSPSVFGQDPGVGEGRPLPMAYSPTARSVLDFSADVHGFRLARMARPDLARYHGDYPRGGPLLSESSRALVSRRSVLRLRKEKAACITILYAKPGRSGFPMEGLRKIGQGLLSSVSWGATGELYYVVDQVLYRILPEEFFTRSLYRAQFQTWGITGKLPFPFRPANDHFWLAPDSRSVPVQPGRPHAVCLPA